MKRSIKIQLVWWMTVTGQYFQHKQLKFVIRFALGRALFSLCIKMARMPPFTDCLPAWLANWMTELQFVAIEREKEREQKKREWSMHLTFTWCWRLHNAYLSLGYRLTAVYSLGFRLTGKLAALFLHCSCKVCFCFFSWLMFTEIFFIILFVNNAHQSLFCFQREEAKKRWVCINLVRLSYRRQPNCKTKRELWFDFINIKPQWIDWIVVSVGIINVVISSNNI